eukprot:gene10601-biopygen3011
MMNSCHEGVRDRNRASCSILVANTLLAVMAVSPASVVAPPANVALPLGPTPTSTSNVHPQLSLPIPNLQPPTSFPP